MNIIVLGGCCKKCDSMFEFTQEAVAELNITATIEKVDDPIEVAKYGVMSTPGIVINGKVVSSGKMLYKDEIIKILKKVIG